MEKAVFFLVCAVTDAPVCLGVCFLHTIKFFITETGAEQVRWAGENGLRRESRSVQ